MTKPSLHDEYMAALPFHVLSLPLASVVQIVVRVASGSLSTIV